MESPERGGEAHRLRHISRPSDLGFALRQLRERSGTTQSELAGVAGVGRKWLSQLENGKATAEIGLILRLVHTLGYEVELLAKPAPVDLPGMLPVFYEQSDSGHDNPGHDNPEHDDSAHDDPEHDDPEQSDDAA